MQSAVTPKKSFGFPSFLKSLKSSFQFGWATIPIRRPSSSIILLTTAVPKAG